MRALGDAQLRHDRPRRRQANPLERDVAEPQHTRPDADPAVAATHGDEPSQRILHRDGERVRARTARERDARMQLPAQRWSADHLQPRRHVVVRLRGRASSRRPHHHLARRPRGLQLHLARRLALWTGSTGGRSDVAGVSGRRSRATVSRRLASVSARSATTWSRSSPTSDRAEARSPSTSMIKRSSTTSDARSSA